MTTPRNATLAEIIEILRRTDMQRRLPWPDDEKRAYEDAGRWSEGFEAVLELRAEKIIAAVVEKVAADLRLYADDLAKRGEPTPFVEGHRHAAIIVDGMQPLAGRRAAKSQEA